MADYTDLISVVPVREGSRRLPGKNLAPFGESNLLVHKISQLKQFLDPQQIVVSSDSNEMLSIAEAQGTRVHWRPREYADDILGKPLGETIRFIASEIDSTHILWSQVTSPLVSTTSYTSAIDRYFSGLVEGYDSLISVERVKDYLRDHAGPLNYKTGAGHTPSQSLPEIYRVTYGIVLAPREDMVRWGYYYGGNPFLFELDRAESVDIDDDLDLQVARALFLHE